MDKKLVYGLFMMLLVTGLFFNLGQVPLKLEEPRRALVTMEMMLSDDFILPTVNGEPYLKKPPLFNWILMGAYTVFGNTSEFVTRLPTVLSFIAAILLVIWAGWKFIEPEFGIIAGLLFGTCVRLLFYGVNFAEIDVFFTLIQLLSVISFFFLYNRRLLYAAFILAYAFCAIALLTKSIPALAFTGLSIVSFLFIKKDFKALFSIAHLAGIIILVLIIGSYLSALSGRIPLDIYFDSLLGDSTERTIAKNGFTGLMIHLFTFPLEFIVSLLPGAFLIIFVFKGRNKFWQMLHENDFILFSCVVFSANFWIYWISPGARMRYVFMLIPFILNVLVYFYWRTGSEERDRLLAMPLRLLSIMAGIALLTASFLVEISFSSKIILIAFGVVLAGLPWAADKLQWARLTGLMVLVILLRLCFDLVILPFRAEGDALSDKRDAKTISTMLEDKPLFVPQADLLNNRPVFYITKYKNEIIREHKGGNGFFLIQDSARQPADSLIFEFEKQPYSVVYRGED